MLLTSVEVSLAVSAWSDLAQRPPEAVNGSKKKWAAVIAINFVGPILYYWRGRRQVAPVQPSPPSGSNRPDDHLAGGQC